MAGAAKTHYGEQLAADLLLGIDPAEDRWIGLFTVAPTDVAASGTEVSTSGTAYGRQPITFGAGVDQSGHGRLYANDLAVLWDTATSNWGTIQEWGIFGDETAGNLIIHDVMEGTPSVMTGQTPSLDIGDVTYLED